uniref:Exosome complex component 10 n=1 Tax=Oryzias sinensis TaxID=183150 RepID=A0A8C7WQ78_9TELE
MSLSKSNDDSNREVLDSNSDTNEEDKNELCPGFKDVDAFVKHGFGVVLSATKASAGLPQPGDEFDFYRSFPGFQEFCESQGDQILQCMSQIMQHHGCRSHVKDRNKLTAVEERFDLVVDSNDVILERAGILLDEADGVNRNQKPVMPAGFQPPKIVVSSWNRKGSGSSSQSETFRLLHAKNIARPQLKFKEKIDNSNTPFVPKIFIKPNAVKPLPSCKKHVCQPEDLDVPAALADLIHQQRTQEHVEDMFAHPYQYELDHLTVPDSLLSKPEPQMYKPIAETKLSFIDSLEDLVELNEKLCKLSEFAVDLEHHSYRSFLGLTCLMQISTRDEDFIIDTLELRSEMYILNEAFTDPTIVKVFHGADSDIEWLQRDFGLYVVNLFDTHQGSRALHLARNSLDHLLRHFCNVDSDKRYQLADWRIRPLPNEMVQYARTDTHYLLYIYDCVRAQLLDSNHGQPGLLQSVWNKSKDISLTKYMKPLFTEDSYLEVLRKQKRSFNTQQLTAFRLLFAWRDKLARQEDESTGYTLPIHMMIKISEELPKEPQGIIACCNPVPPLVRQQVNELHLLVQQAREMPLLKVRRNWRQHWHVGTVFTSLKTSKVLVLQLINLFETLVDYFNQCFVLKEPDVHTEQNSLSVAQMKARRIIESFENPFRMVGNVKSLTFTILYLCFGRLIMLLIPVFTFHRCACQQECQESAKSTAKKRETPASEVGEVTPKPAKKLKAAEKTQKTETPSQTSFKPFDYSQSDLKVFAGTKSKDNSQFDPNRQGQGFKKKVPQGQKKHNSAGNRSMSYMAGKSERGFRHNWPKR